MGSWWRDCWQCYGEVAWWSQISSRGTERTGKIHPLLKISTWLKLCMDYHKLPVVFCCRSIVVAVFINDGLNKDLFKFFYTILNIAKFLYIFSYERIFLLPISMFNVRFISFLCWVVASQLVPISILHTLRKSGCWFRMSFFFYKSSEID